MTFGGDVSGGVVNYAVGYFNGVTEKVEDLIPLIDKWGGPETFPHMAAGWAVAFDTPPAATEGRFARGAEGYDEASFLRLAQGKGAGFELRPGGLFRPDVRGFHHGVGDLHDLAVSGHDLTGRSVDHGRDSEPERSHAPAGEGLDEPRARRAIDLSLEKYCSVMHSLAPDIAVTYALSLA